MNRPPTNVWPELTTRAYFSALKFHHVGNSEHVFRAGRFRENQQPNREVSAIFPFRVMQFAILLEVAIC